MPPPIIGWIPSNPGGDVVDVPPSQASGQFTFRVSPPDLSSSPSSSSSLADYFTSADTPSGSSNSISLGSTSQDTETEKIRRPKNPFIIFRSEFARLHHNPRSRRGGVNPTPGRSVSRKAGDAWRLLSPKEKAHYQHLAELEKEQHARDHPNYQYRPQRRKNGPRRSSPSAPKRRRASPALTIRTAHGTPSGSDVVTLSPPPDDPPSSPELDFQQPPVDPAVKADRRRSSSVPVTFGEHLYTATLWGGDESVQWERPERWERPHETKRRSRSVTQEWVNMAHSFQAPEHVYIDPRSPQTAHFSPETYPTFFRALSPNAYFDTHNATVLFPRQHMSPLTAVASSLAGWNGEPSLPVAPVAPQPMRLQQPPWLAEADAVKFEPTSPAFDVKDPLSSLAGDLTWSLEPTAQYVFGPGSAGPSAHEQVENVQDYVRTEALQEYEHGLQERVRVADESTLFDELRY